MKEDTIQFHPALLIRQYLTTSPEAKYLCTNRPIALNKTLTIDRRKNFQFDNSLSTTDAISSRVRITVTVLKSPDKSAIQITT
ncbi:MAG: hypothetical protein ACYT04_53870 [Nostoc sp.]